MTPERFRQIRNLFEAALERDARLRPTFLAEACQGDEPLHEEVGRLLAAHQQEAALLDRGAVRPELLTGEPGRMEGRRIDHYQVLRELGRGGMGSVYLALRTDDVYRKPVALKVARPEAANPETIERFRREREILASLDHPNVARLLDGGTTPEGLPYFVMDYVEGQPIDAYCDEHQLNVNERLKLFRSICVAVEYAHHRGVVHRDLKPRNVLVTADGSVKLLDFGIAKLLRTDVEETVITLTGMRLMTPEYASPEQVRGESVGTASDIYSLGVILFELLTGHRPYRMRSRLIHEVVRVICEEEPTRPSTAVTESEPRLAAGDDNPQSVTPQSVSRSRADTPAGLRRRLSGDLDKIVLKALRKNPSQRYSAAEAFGEDVRRHLDGLPVLAQGESVVYRARKFLQRYRGWAITAVLLSGCLAAGIVKISAQGTIILLSLLTLLPAAYYAVRRQYGHDIAYPAVIRIGGGIAISLVIFLFLLSLPGPYAPVVFGLGGAMVVALFVTSLVRWPFRARWAGPLLLELTSSKDRKGLYGLAIICAISTILLVAWIIRGGQFLLLDARLIGLACIWLVTIWGFGGADRIELRPRGTLISGFWLPWSSVESYAWQDTGSEFVVLKLRSKTWLWFLLALGSTVAIPLPAAQKGPTDAILKRQLAEWPGESSS